MNVLKKTKNVVKMKNVKKRKTWQE